ncbi:hypothetical protein MCOR27_008980 [Pyricularia oryzae]|uniref:Uncharacterized protein n=4 Tax=Pyricularia oryzae TaxID=318829 RepID=G4NG11_PYRO7|nr:uncharacterized protein MGG_17593 [Pyricularia oryzae 70-15]ELQ35522.1 hypothetical protein OOU_Y34scaffold00706g26 [Pyricularia oryzae Y34]KAH8845503.1 hypothetical protein MCOR01_002742 [Pyricularia oryzae]EHA46968.1 hypothetical protein MGG_17593 [Pyricularia oryzae 70-15]KAI6271071.1 hypothetical protein MCOR27_008980 [Pyricularia oryzae]KAI6287518.1 hypothetical protein MCOR34_010871 [Pyricularia oryzae]
MTFSQDLDRYKWRTGKVCRSQLPKWVGGLIFHQEREVGEVARGLGNRSESYGSYRQEGVGIRKGPLSAIPAG